MSLADSSGIHVSDGRPESTETLAKTELWQKRPEFLSAEERIQLSYKRAQSVMQHYKLSTDDVLNLSERYWACHSDPIFVLDPSVSLLLTVHCNLCLGTIAMYLPGRLDLQPIADKLASFEWNGIFCITELGHGLDIINMETRATRLPDGSFELHTPSDAAAKFMPSTSPSGYPCVAIVHARLFVDGEDRGPKVFLIQLNDGKVMSPGVTAKVFSPVSSSKGLRHCLTYFNHVRLPESALLSSLEKPRAPREAFFYNISRVITGTLTVGLSAVTAMRVSSYIAASYSLRRHVIDSSTKLSRPIISFSTQYTPILSAIAQSLVLRKFADSAHNKFVRADDLTTKHFIAAVLKTTAHKIAHPTLIELGDRCGAQGLADVNQLAGLHSGLRAAAIAEGDILVISIRFAMDLLRGRAFVPPYNDSNALLSRHERSLISSLKILLANSATSQDGSIDTAVLPLCQPLVEAIGARMAFEAASDHLPKDVLDLFVASIVKKNAAWFALNAGLDGPAQFRMEAEAARALLPRIKSLMDSLDAEPYVVAPIVSDDKWNQYMTSLDTYGEIESIVSKY